jgi:hypothetical protein
MHQLVLVAGAVTAYHDLLDAGRQRGDGPLHQAKVAAKGRHIAVAELVGQHDVLLGPQCDPTGDHRLIAGPPVIGWVGGAFVAGQDGGVDVDRGDLLRRPLLQKADQLAVGGIQPLQPIALVRHRTALALPQRRAGLVESGKKVPCRLRRRQSMTEQ